MAKAKGKAKFRVVVEFGYENGTAVTIVRANPPRLNSKDDMANIVCMRSDRIRDARLIHDLGRDLAKLLGVPFRDAGDLRLPCPYCGSKLP